MLNNDKNQGLNIQIVVWQFLVLLMLLFFFYLKHQDRWVVALAWGGMASMLNVLLISRCIQKKIKNIEVARQLRIMYRSVIERFFIVIGLITFGLIKLHLLPLAVFIGFIACQLVYIIATVLVKMTSRQ